MSWRSNGGYFGPRPTGPSTSVASGWWDSRSQFRSRRDGQWPVNGDPSWSNVSLLLQMDGSNGSTTFTDSSSNALSVTAVGNAQISTAQAKFGQSGLFDGSGDYLSIANNSVFDVGSGNFTLEAWVRPTTSTANLRLIYVKRTAGIAHMALAVNAGNFTFWAATATSSWDIVNGVTFGAASLDTWYHIAVVRNGNSFTGYRDGVGTSLATSSATIGTGSTAAVTIGGEPSGNAFSGHLDDYRITKGVARYTANFTPSTVAHPVG
jgi:hypothetical protein